MRRSDLEHVIRAAAAITNEYEIVVVGSQSLLGAVPQPSALLVEPHDLAASKLAAGREKDWIFVAEMLDRNIVQPDVLLQRIASLPVSEDRRGLLIVWVKARATGA